MLEHLFGNPKDIAAKIPILAFFIRFVSSNDSDYGGFVAILSVVLLFYGLGFTDISQAQVFSIVIALTPLWLTWYIFVNFFDKWSEYTGKKFGLYNGRTTLRINLPQEVLKSPEAMEFVISQIHNTANPDNLMQTYLQGKRPLNFSFELVSIGGDVRFYANLPTSKTKAAFEANMYAQYPGVEIVEEPVDYAAEIGLDSDWEWFSCHMRKKKDEVFPIKTYIDFGLDKLPKEEEKVDPMTPMLEVLGGVGPSERLYIQYICTPFRPSSFSNGQLMFGEGSGWDKGVTAALNKIMNRDPDTRQAIDSGNSEEVARLTQGERDAVAAMERNAGKYAYNVGIRWVYASRPGHFAGDRINPIIRSFSQYDIISDIRNQIGVAWRTDIDYKDLIPGSYKKIEALKVQELKEYKLRKYFNKGGADGMKIFTAEELATMFHIPGQVAFTPTLSRVPSTRSEAPNNLPVGNLPE